MKLPVLIGIGFTGIVSFILGRYLGNHGPVATFADAGNPMRLPLMVLAL